MRRAPSVVNVTNRLKVDPRRYGAARARTSRVASYRRLVAAAMRVSQIQRRDRAHGRPMRFGG